jgi:hypothetical protein
MQLSSKELDLLVDAVKSIIQASQTILDVINNINKKELQDDTTEL